MSRDSAYHQGTVWPWLMGPFVRELVKVKGSAGKEQANALISNMAAHLEHAGVGTISGIFDGAAPP